MRCMCINSDKLSFVLILDDAIVQRPELRKARNFTRENYQFRNTSCLLTCHSVVIALH